MKSTHALFVIKAKDETLSQSVEVEGFFPGLATVGTENLTLSISYQEHCIVTVSNIFVKSCIADAIFVDSKEELPLSHLH